MGLSHFLKLDGIVSFFIGSRWKACHKRFKQRQGINPTH